MNALPIGDLLPAIILQEAHQSEFEGAWTLLYGIPSKWRIPGYKNLVRGGGF